MSQTERRSDIQGLRGFAVLVVVLYHADVLFRGGFLGVDVFFVISGFVITGSLRRELGERGSIEFGRFYGRRARRLLPAAGLATLCTMLFAPVFGAYTDARSASHTALAALGFNANNYLALFGTGGGYFGADAQSNPVLHFWSLSVEEQFYLAFPVLLLQAWRWRRTGRDSTVKRPGIGDRSRVPWVSRCQLA